MKILVVSSDRTDAHGGACNLGDAFLTDALVASLQAGGHLTEVADFGSVQRSTSDGARISVAGLRGLSAAVRRSDAVIVGGGTLFQDDQPDRVVGGLPRLCAAVAMTAQLHKRPLGFYGVGLDPIERRIPRGLVGYASRRAVEVWLREADSCARYSSYFGREAALGADASLLALSVEMGLPSVAPQSGVVTVALNRSDARSVSSSELETLRERWPVLQFLAMDQQVDNSDALALQPAVARQFDMPNRVVGWREAATIVAGSEVVIASRMHALYLALILGIPAVAVGSHPKVVSFAREFGIKHVSMASLAAHGVGQGEGPAVRDAAFRARSSLDQLLAALCLG